jgi:hypothetical protein
MYRVIRAGILYFENSMRGCKGRYDLIKPLMLLVDTSKFKEAKNNNLDIYKNLCDIIGKIRDLYLTGEDRYHHFGMLLEELFILGFDVKDMKRENTTSESVLKDEVDLLIQFLSFKYSSDEFDNKTGVHDAKTNEYIFIQP